MKRVVITGATSMIGIALIRECIAHEVKVYAVIRPDSFNANRIPHSEWVEIVECDLGCLSKLRDLINEPCDVFYHLGWGHTGAGRNDNLMYQTDNIAYTLQAVHAAEELHCCKFVGAGSQAEYGLCNDSKISPETAVNPVQAYGIAKYAAGKLAMIECKKCGMTCVWVRIFSVYGEDDKKTSMISSSIEKMLDGRETGFTAGEQVWDYLYSSDAGNAIYLIGEKVCKSKVYCLGSGEGRKLKEYIQIIGDIVHPESDLGLGKIPYNSETVMNLCADISSLKKDTGFEPQVSFEEGIEKIYLAKKRERMGK